VLIHPSFPPHGANHEGAGRRAGVQYVAGGSGLNTVRAGARPFPAKQFTPW
jgi:hypothetical protein